MDQEEDIKDADQATTKPRYNLSEQECLNPEVEGIDKKGIGNQATTDQRNNSSEQECSNPKDEDKKEVEDQGTTEPKKTSSGLASSNPDIDELNKLFTGKKYKTRAALISTVTQYLTHRSTSWLTAGIQKLPRGWQNCVDVGGEYFEKEKNDFLMLVGFRERVKRIYKKEIGDQESSKPIHYSSVQACSIPEVEGKWKKEIGEHGTTEPSNNSSGQESSNPDFGDNGPHGCLIDYEIWVPNVRFLERVVHAVKKNTSCLAQLQCQTCDDLREILDKHEILIVCRSKCDVFNKVNRNENWKKVQVLITKRTKIEVDFIEAIKGIFEDISFEGEISSDPEHINANFPLFVVCPLSSRLESDIDYALNGIKVERRFVVILLHSYSESCLPAIPTASKVGHMGKYENIDFIDIAYNFNDKLYQCRMNTEAKKLLKSFCTKFYTSCGH